MYMVGGGRDVWEYIPGKKEEKSYAPHPQAPVAAARVAVPRCDLYSYYGYRELDLKGVGVARLP